MSEMTTNRSREMDTKEMIIIEGIAEILTSIEEPGLSVEPTLATLVQDGEIEPAVLIWPSDDFADLTWGARTGGGWGRECGLHWPDLEPHIPEDHWRTVIGDAAIYLNRIELEEGRHGLRAVCSGRLLGDFAYGWTGWRLHRPDAEGVMEDLRDASIIADTSIEDVRAWEGSHLQVQDLCAIMCEGNYANARRYIENIAGDTEWVTSVLGRATELIEEAEERAIDLLETIVSRHAI
ncbi:MAG: hypothetical protein ACQEVA_01310 [Myxococcota bacterium]